MRSGNAALIVAVLASIGSASRAPEIGSRHIKHSVSYELKPKGFCTHLIDTIEECSKAAAEMNLEAQVAVPDGQNGVAYDPPYCYMEGGQLHFNAGGKNTGVCSEDDKCVCKKDSECGPPGLNEFTTLQHMQDMGWEFDMTNPDMEHACDDDFHKKKRCYTGSNWFGWSKPEWGDDGVGTIRAHLDGYGSVSINFGNCWEEGVVNAYVNGKKMASAGPGQVTTLAFDLDHRVLLELKDESGDAVIQLNGITFICDKCSKYKTADTCPNRRCSWDVHQCRYESQHEVTIRPKGHEALSGFSNQTNQKGLTNFCPPKMGNSTASSLNASKDKPAQERKVFRSKDVSHKDKRDKSSALVAH